MGEIPVLEEDGVRLTQTAPILLKLAEQYGRFGGESSAEKYEVLRWLFWDNHKLTGYMATYRFLRTFTPTPDPNVLQFLRRRLDDFLGILDAQVQANAFVAGDRPTIADLSMIAYLHYPSDETGYDLAASHPAIDQWLKRVAALPGLAIGIRSVAGQTPDALRRKRSLRLLARYLLLSITQPSAISPMTTATATAQTLTRIELVVCRALSLAAISRSRSFSPVGSVTAWLQRWRAALS